MDYWRQTGRPAIFEALAHVCDQIDSDLLAELKGARELTNPGEGLSRSVPPESANSLVNQLKEENASLRMRLAATKGATKPDDAGTLAQRMHGAPAKTPVDKIFTSSTTLVSPVSSDPSLSEKQQADFKLEYANLSARFNALSENFKKAKAALERRKEERDRWIQHANHLENKIRAAEAEHKIRILDRGQSTPRQSPHPPVPKTAVAPSPQTSFNDTTGVVNALPPLPEPSTDVAPPAVDAETTLPGSTQDEPEDELPQLLTSDSSPPPSRIKQEPSSDTPVVVSERAVRKRKRDDGSADSAVHQRIKMEESDGSSPTIQKKGFNFSPEESIDLGEVSGIMATPRKRKDFEHTPMATGTVPLSTASVATPTPLMVRPDGFPQTTRPNQFSSALTPISVNRRIIRSGGDRPAPKPNKNLGRYIGALAENGAVYDANPSDLRPTGARLNPAIKSKLDLMLNDDTSEDGSTDVLQTPRQRSGPSTLYREISFPARRELPFDKTPRASSTADRAGYTSVSANIPRQAHTSVQTPETVRTRRKGMSLLRNKPVSELRLEDFKVNPLVNDGQDFAFSEVVRNKADRACLPGCTDMRCCGKEFRALAISQQPNPPLTPAQKEAEHNLLEDYLGEQAYRLRNMNEQERAELWIEAKTQELANKYGKHRHRYSRMQSPPGFWNADFPSTQELEADRSEATKREQAAVKERYREAMRPGGRWLFRDE